MYLWPRLNGAQRLRATNKKEALIHSVTINEKTKKDCAPSENSLYN